VQAGRAVVVSVADGYLRLCRISTAMAAAPYHGKLRGQLLRGNGRIQDNQITNDENLLYT